MTAGRWLRRGAWVAAGLLVALALVRSFAPVPTRVDVAEIARGVLTVTADADGRTRVRERYTMSAPVQGRLRRSALRPGDPVLAGGTVVAEFVPVAPSLLDARSRSEDEARILRARAAVDEAEAVREQAAADLEFARSELRRVRELRERDIESPAAFEQAQRDATRASEALRAAEFSVQVARFELDLARASLGRPASDADEEAAREFVESAAGRVVAPDGRLRIRSPVDGTVLRVFEESARTLAAGTPILEVGNTAALEVVADYLSQDAVKIRAGMEVRITGWGGESEAGEPLALLGRVRVVEPAGFTKVSALGVEEQRVNVIVDPQDDAEAWAALGDGFRVDLHVVLWEQSDVLVVPTGALFRDGGSWACFAVSEGRAELRRLQLGRRSGLAAQVLGGLEVGEQVVLYPSELIGPGSAVRAR